MVKHQRANSHDNYHYNAYIYSGRGWESHFHTSYELLYCMEGECSVTLNSECFSLAQGELMLIPPYTVHSFVVPALAKLWVGVFSSDHISTFAKAYPYSCFVCFCLDEKTEEFLKRELFYEGSPERFRLISSLYLACDAGLRDEKSILKPADKRIQLIVDYIFENISEEITLTKMASELGYEYHYLSAVFHKCFNMNFKDFVNRFRFEAACKCLLESTETVTAVSEQCGFASVRSFNRIFKDLSGMTPTQYRKNSQV